MAVKWRSFFLKMAVQKRYRKRTRKRNKNSIQSAITEPVQNESNHINATIDETQTNETIQPKLSPYKALPKKLAKYYRHRHSLFSLFDKGIQLDEESWYSVTPEKIAAYIAEKCYNSLKSTEESIVVDAFCGAGGNSIQFAMYFDQGKKIPTFFEYLIDGMVVIAIDIDPNKLALAKINAEIYGVSHKIQFIEGDALLVLPTLPSCSLIFASPPWGGPEYLAMDKFKLGDMKPDGVEFYNIAKRVCEELLFFLPRNSCCDEV